MTPIVNGLEEEFDGKASVISLDASVPANARLQSAYGLRGHPTLVVLGKDGRVSRRFFGPVTAGSLRDALAMVTGQ